jgi:hypothetical protein
MFFINVIKNACENHMLLKKHVILTCLKGQMSLLYVGCRKFLSITISLRRKIHITQNEKNNYS